MVVTVQSGGCGVVGALTRPSCVAHRNAQARVRDGHRVALPAGCPRPIYDIIISCCRGDRGSRPPFKDLVAELGLYHRNESVKETTRDVGQLFKSAGK